VRLQLLLLLQALALMPVRTMALLLV